MSRPANTKEESIMSVANAVVWAFTTYGVPNGGSGTRPSNTKEESIKSVAEAIFWAWSN